MEVCLEREGSGCAGGLSTPTSRQVAGLDGGTVRADLGRAAPFSLQAGATPCARWGRALCTLTTVLPDLGGVGEIRDPLLLHVPEPGFISEEIQALDWSSMGAGEEFSGPVDLSSLGGSEAHHLPLAHGAPGGVDQEVMDGASSGGGGPAGQVVKGSGLREPPSTSKVAPPLEVGPSEPGDGDVEGVDLGFEGRGPVRHGNGELRDALGRIRSYGTLTQ